MSDVFGIDMAHEPRSLVNAKQALPRQIGAEFASGASRKALLTWVLAALDRNFAPRL
jgi:hypothetical protein